MTGRTRTATDGAGSLAHAVAYAQHPAGLHLPALCGARPGKRSGGWSEYRPAAVTCPRCLAKLNRTPLQVLADNLTAADPVITE
jgi:hypothetical protein